jgi:hypothetical protein
MYFFPVLGKDGKRKDEKRKDPFTALLYLGKEIDTRNLYGVLIWRIFHVSKDF